MKIVFLSHTDSNLFRFRLPVMLELLKNGHEVIALTPKGADFDKFAPLGIQAISYNINRSSLNPLSFLKTLKELVGILKELRPDILHSFMLKPNIFASFSAPFAKIPCVINSLTGLGSFYIDTSIKARILKFIIEFLNFFAFKIAKKVLFQNSDDLTLYVKKGLVSKQKAVLIKGSGIDVEYFKPFLKSEREALRERYLSEFQRDFKLEIPQNSKIILMIARAILHKGVLEFYQAARILEKEHKDYIFVYVGGVDCGNISPISEAFLKGQKSVLYLGERSDIKELLGVCDVFVLPSFREGIPRTLLEASSMEKAIVATNAVGCKEVVEHNKNGLLVPLQDSKALAESIIKLCENDNLREEFGKNGREKMIKEFSTKAVVKEYLELYGEATDSAFSSTCSLFVNARSEATRQSTILDLQVWANRYREARHENSTNFLAMTKRVKSTAQSLQTPFVPSLRDFEKAEAIHNKKIRENKNIGIYQRFFKPCFDFSLSLVLLLLFSPIILIISILIYFKMGKPIFFTQERPGKNGKIFKIYKFRTMQELRDENGELLPDSARLKGFGKALRKTSLDELPQLFNVLRGEMSFIGPRPLLVEYLPLYSKIQARRHEVKPGITGWAQVNGRNAISWEDKFRLDVWYVDNICFLLDLKIFFLTFYKVIRKKDINSNTSVTMEKFRGSCG